MKELLTLIIQNIESFEKSLKFRKGQKPFYDAIIQGLKRGWETMYIEGPTGMGKTFIEAVLSAAIIGDSHIKVLLLTSKITLLQQIQREFKKFVGFLKTGLFGGGFKDHSEQVTIMTYASFVNLDESIAQQYSVVLLDEGHKGLGEKTKVKLELQKEFSLLIGFTASAEYSQEKSLEIFLKNLAYKLSIAEAVELGMLSNIKVMIASVDIEISSQEKGETRGDYEERISADIIREGGNIACARLYKRVFALRNLRGIALVLTKNQGNDLVEQFANEGVKAELIHSGLKRIEREDMFNRFKNHEFSVLVGMGIIKEGFDDPGVSVAMTTYPVNSRVDMTQFPGRAERIDEDNPDKIAYIVNLAYKSKKQLFYTDILDGKSEVLQKKKRTRKLDIISSSEMQSAIATKPDSFITSVAVTEEEVKEIMRLYQSINYLSYEELKKVVQEAGVNNLKKYREAKKRYPNWIANPWRTYKDKYSFKDFFGKQTIEFLNYSELRSAVQTRGITSRVQYKKAQKDEPSWPSHPWRIYSEEYSNDDFFGKKTMEFLNYSELRSAVQTRGIKSTTQYIEAQKSEPSWPSCPWNGYVDLYSNDDFFGKYLPYQELRSALQARGIRTKSQYKIVQESEPSWPSNPWKKYSDQYSNDDFFGKQAIEFLNYSELRSVIQERGIGTMSQYVETQKSESTWPSCPWRIYSEEYSNDDFFGKTK